MKKLFLSLASALLLTAVSAFASGNCITGVSLLLPDRQYGPHYLDHNSYEWHADAGGSVSFFATGGVADRYDINAAWSNADCNYDLLFSSTVWFRFQTTDPCSSNPRYLGELYYKVWNQGTQRYDLRSVSVYMPGGVDIVNVAIVQTPSWCNNCACLDTYLNVCVQPVHYCTPNGN